MFSEFPQDLIDFQKDICKFANKHLKQNTFREKWDKCAQLGIQGLPFDEEYGGSNSSMAQIAIAIEALGETGVDRGLIFSLCAHLFACSIPISKFGDKRQKEQFLSQMICGKVIGANAITEAESGSDAFALQTTAEKLQDGYNINGSKIYVTNAPIADFFLCYAKTAPKLGHFGISAFMIPRDTKGLSVGQSLKKIGLENSPLGSVYFNDCFVPEEYRLGKEGNGARIFEISMHWERTFLFAFYVGLMKYLLGVCWSHINKRRQFNEPLVSYQAISHKFVDMKLRYETSRYLLYKAVYSLEQNKSSQVIDSCLAKLHISQASVQTALDAIQMHGGIGTITEGGIEEILRDTIPSTIFSGTTEIMKENVIRELKKRM